MCVIDWLIHTSARSHYHCSLWLYYFVIATTCYVYVYIEEVIYNTLYLHQQRSHKKLLLFLFFNALPYLPLDILAPVISTCTKSTEIRALMACITDTYLIDAVEHCSSMAHIRQPSNANSASINSRYIPALTYYSILLHRSPCSTSLLVTSMFPTSTVKKKKKDDARLMMSPM